MNSSPSPEADLKFRDYSNVKTAFDIKDLIKRCFDELEQSKNITKMQLKLTAVGGIQTEETNIEHRVLLNEDIVADHIAKTLIGELLEFEILRRLGPAYRSINSVENDLNFLFRKEQQEKGLSGLRIGQK